MDAPRTIGKYEILSTLGRGGMGVVYRARDALIGRDVAIKQLSANSEDLRNRFLLETRSGVLNHPNLVTIYDVGEQDGCPYLVMEFLAGQPLDHILKVGRLTVSEKLDILRQVCSGLAYAHGRGVVHRDIKPANIMVAPDLHAKILDFGIAKLESLSSVTRTGNIIGTIYYMAPERFKGATSDGRADVWSCGVVLYQMLTGQLPFDGEDVAVMQKVLNDAPFPLSRYIPNVPPELEAVLAHALAKDPEKRPTADQLGLELEHLATLPGVRSLSAPKPPEPPKPIPPHDLTPAPPSSAPPSFTDLLRGIDSARLPDAPRAPQPPSPAMPLAPTPPGSLTELFPSAASTRVLREDTIRTTQPGQKQVMNITVHNEIKQTSNDEAHTK